MAVVGRNDHFFKVVMVGDSCVGKSAILWRYVNRTFSDPYIRTTDIKLKIRTIQLEGKTVELEVWDTAEQEYFYRITSSYYRGVHGIIIVYDITNYETFNIAKQWIKEIGAKFGRNVNVMLVDNKSDLNSNRTVQYNLAKVSKYLSLLFIFQSFADEVSIPFLETSAKGPINVDQAFITMATNIKNRMEPLQPIGHRLRARTDRWLLSTLPTIRVFLLILFFIISGYIFYEYFTNGSPFTQYTIIPLGINHLLLEFIESINWTNININKI